MEDDICSAFGLINPAVKCQKMMRTTPMRIEVEPTSTVGRVYDGDSNDSADGGEEHMYYQTEGCFSQRNCTVYNATKESMAEIRRKVDQSTSVLLGKDMFMIYMKPGFDGAFAMGLVLVLDQIKVEDEGKKQEGQTWNLIKNMRV
ncbi:hypothetical protein K1719_010825 [Acacia pycnantha]|nr:hypothetical protein K1719_010825 [Acacia pycnantha]